MTEVFTDSDAFVSYISLVRFGFGLFWHFNYDCAIGNTLVEYAKDVLTLKFCRICHIFLLQECTFPTDATPAQKATIVGAAIFINAVFFEGEDGEGGGS